MSQKLFKLVLIKSYKEAYYQLSEEEKERLYAQIGRNVEKAGAKMVGPYYNCRWSNDQYQMFFLMEYPDLESALKDAAEAEAFELFRYLDSETILAVVDSESTNP